MCPLYIHACYGYSRKYIQPVSYLGLPSVHPKHTPNHRRSNLISSPAPKPRAPEPAGMHPQSMKFAKLAGLRAHNLPGKLCGSLQILAGDFDLAALQFAEICRLWQ